MQHKSSGVISTNRDSGYQVGLATKLAYSSGAISDSIKTTSFSIFLLFYYTTVLGLSGTLLGLAMAVGLVWDAAIDPMIGHVSDRSTIKFGRRHSFMLVGAVCAAASYIAMFNPPLGFSAGALFLWLLISDLFFRSSQSLFMVPYYALGAELTTDYHERTSISGFRAAAGLAGMMLTAAAAFFVFHASGSGAGASAGSSIGDRFRCRTTPVRP
jgi:Na+/melibiose symporter-like transporter